MAIGDILKQITQGVSGFNNLAFDPNSDPSPADLVKAREPMAENRGFWNILSNIGGIGARQRVLGEQERQEREKHAADMELKKQQAKATGSLSTERETRAVTMRDKLGLERDKLDMQRINTHDTLALKRKEIESKIEIAQQELLQVLAQ